MNEQVGNNRLFKGAKDFKEAINRFFDDILPSMGNSLDGRINDNFQALKLSILKLIGYMLPLPDYKMD